MQHDPILKKNDMKKSLVFLFVFASLLITACSNDAANDNDAVDTRSNDAPAGPASYHGDIFGYRADDRLLY